MVHEALAQSARPLDAPAQIGALAGSICGDQRLGELVQECFEIVGPHGVVEVRPAYGSAHDREYIQGVLWDEGWAASSFAAPGGTAVLEQPYILLADHRLRRAEDVAPALRAVKAAGERGLVVIASAIEGAALNTLVTNHVRGHPGAGAAAAERGIGALRDLA